jgi:fatty acid/phospholipid biosynthesis enzyme
MRIVIDCFGGYLPPSEIVPFAFRAAEDEQVDIILVGDEKILTDTIAEQKLASLAIGFDHQFLRGFNACFARLQRGILLV